MSPSRLLLVSLAVAAAPPAARGADCVDCHDGAFNADAWKTSRHHRADAGPAGGCATCHADIQATEDGHGTPRKVDCGSCHKVEARDHAAGVHAARPAQGGREAREQLACTACHDDHVVARLTPERRRFLSVTPCAGCHQEAMKVYGASLHGTSKDLASATCADCHRSHKILDAKDPDSPTHHLNQAKTCAACHADGNRSPKMTPEHVKSVRAYFGSAHGFAITQAGLIHSATCGDCHGTHTVELHGNKGSPVDRARIPETCGKCHVGVLRVYVESIHGKPFQEGNTDVPVCTDCHRTHDIRSRLERVSSTYGTNVSKTCLRCHANTQYVNKYSFPGLRGETYQQSYHGAASKLGDPNVASCASCHEAHDIRKSTDPLSSVNPANMVKTCGKCHKVEDPSKPMAFGKIHLGLAEESHWLTSIIERIYFLIIGGSMLLYAVYMTGDFIRSRRRSRRKSAAA